MYVRLGLGTHAHTTGCKVVRHEQMLMTYYCLKCNLRYSNEQVLNNQRGWRSLIPKERRH
jgi:hypothetical protein